MGGGGGIGRAGGHDPSRVPAMARISGKVTPLEGEAEDRKSPWKEWDRRNGDRATGRSPPPAGGESDGPSDPAAATAPLPQSAEAGSLDRLPSMPPESPPFRRRFNWIPPTSLTPGKQRSHGTGGVRRAAGTASRRACRWRPRGGSGCLHAGLRPAVGLGPGYTHRRPGIKGGNGWNPPAGRGSITSAKCWPLPKGWSEDSKPKSNQQKTPSLQRGRSKQGLNHANCAILRRNLRENPKAAPAPRKGRGDGTPEVVGVSKAVA
jgi:hypothetical protein